MVRGTRSPQPRKLTASRSERGASTLTSIPFFPPDPYPEHARGQELAARDPQARRLLLANMGVLRRAQPAAPDGTPRHQNTSQATLTSGNGTEAPTRTPPNPQDTARYGTRQAGKHKHEHRTTEQAQHPGAVMGSTGIHRGGPKGPCH